MRAASPGLATTSRLSRRVTFDGFFSRRWFIFALRRMTLPVLVILNRLAAPRCVFIFGMGAGSSTAPSPRLRATWDLLRLRLLLRELRWRPRRSACRPAPLGDERRPAPACREQGP